MKTVLLMVVAWVLLAVPAQAAVVSGEQSDSRSDVSSSASPRPGEGPSPGPNDVEATRVEYDDAGSLRLALRFWDRDRPHAFYRFHADLGVAGPGAACDVNSQGSLRLTLIAEDTPYSPEAIVSVVGASQPKSFPNAGRIDAERVWHWTIDDALLRGRTYNCVRNIRYTALRGATDTVPDVCLGRAGGNGCAPAGPLAPAAATVFDSAAMVEASALAGPAEVTAQSSETVTISAAADAHVRSDSAGTNFGTRGSLGVDASPTYISFLRFNLGAYAGRKLETASLQLRTTSATESGSTGTQNVKLASNDSWTETGVTYTNRPSAGASVGALAARAINTVYTGSLAVAGIGAKLGGNLSLAVDSASTDRAEFNSRETTSGPKLVLTFALADTTAPTVTQVSPADGATDVAPSANITASFSEAMDPATFTASTVSLKDGTGGVVAANVSYDATQRMVRLDPAADLSSAVSHTVTVSGGATGVKDMAGNPLAANRTWSFTTATASAPPAAPIPDLADIFDMNLQGGDWPAVGSAISTSDKGPYAGVHHPEHIYVRDDPKGVRLGGAARKVLELRTYDSDTGPTSNPRTQLDGPYKIAEGQEVWWGFAYLLPVNFPTRVERGAVNESPFHTIASNGGSGSTGGTNRISLGSYGGTWKFGARFDGTGSWFWSMPRTVDKWIDVVFHVKYARDASGFLEVYKNEGAGWQIQTLDPYVGGGTRYNGPTSKDTEEFPKMPRIANYYLKDQYKHLGLDPVTIFVTEHKLASTFEKARPHSYG